MKFTDITNLWEVDSHIDRSELGNAALDIPILHNKYFKIYSQERYQFKTLEIKLKALRLAKFEFYSQGPSPDTPSHWKLPAIGRVLKTDVGTYIDSDPDIIELQLKINAQFEKLDYLEAILKNIVNRGFQVKSAIDWEKFRNGIN